MLKHGSLFSGIGGFELAAEWMGWKNVFHCEKNEFGSQVIGHYWPESKHFEDVTKTDFSQFRNGCDVLTGGFPCQPFSQAGSRRGTDDERHLFPEMLRVIGEVRPRWIIGENVYGLLNIQSGYAFEQICIGLENAGYEVRPFIMPALAVGAPHQRNRIFFVAHSKDIRWNSGNSWLRQNFDSKGKWNIYECGSQWRNVGAQPERCSQGQSFADALRSRLSQLPQKRNIRSQGTRADKQPAGRIRTKWEKFPTQHPLCSGNDGLSARLDRITFPQWRKQTLMAYGNAVVPQLVFEIFKVIEEVDKLNQI
jgi:DNA (cytosine-5)-methyltransferase 1